MAKQVIGRAVKPPEGWEFVDGILQPKQEFSSTTFNTLYAWAKERKYGLEPQESYWIQSGYSIHCKYKVFTDSWNTTLTHLGDGTWQINARSNAKKLSLGHFAYYSPGGALYSNSCGHCGRYGLATWYVHNTRLCSTCSTPCVRECGNRVYIHGDDGPDKGVCLSCIPRERCHSCGIQHPLDKIEEVGKYKFCKSCADKRRCSNCNEIEVAGIKALGGKLLCKGCYGNALDSERLPHEKFTPEELPKGGSLKIESLVNRPVRIVSIETEVDGDPNALANTLYNEGLVREAFVESYGTECPDTSSWPAFLKYDGSVTGGELINFLLDFNKDEHADSFRNVLSKLRSLEKIEKVKYNANCGGHIHIDAHNFSSDNVWRLLTVYNYLEDVIFRLAGAGHKYGHRTLVEGHDRANHGRGYSHPTPKGPWGIKSGAYNAVARQDRMTGLNFQPYLGAVEYCACGAGAENLRSCKCTLPKCTIEWRVWNSQGNPRIIHGWIAFMQALHAWADTPREMTNEEEQQYPVLAWTKQPWKKTSAGHRKIALERVKWIFENLVFTDAERDSLVYAFEKTDIEFPNGFLDDCRATPAPKNRTVKAPRHCSARKKEIEISKPERKVFGDARTDPHYAAFRHAARRALRWDEVPPAAPRRRPRLAGGIR